MSRKKGGRGKALAPPDISAAAYESAARKVMEMAQEGTAIEMALVCRFKSQDGEGRVTQYVLPHYSSTLMNADECPLESAIALTALLQDAINVVGKPGTVFKGEPK